MKKRLLSLVLCLVMVFSLLPFAGFAAESVTQPDSTVITNPDAVVDGTGNLHLSKTLAQNQDDGTYSINLESFATADVSTVTTTEKIPTDFIVIVDQSGSMATTDMAASKDSYTKVTGSTYPNLETVAAGRYYYLDESTGQYYRVYGKHGYLYYKYPANTRYANDFYGTSLFYYFSDETTTASGANGYYYYNTEDQAWYPISMAVEGHLIGEQSGMLYECRFSYDRNGTQVALPYSSSRSYHAYRQLFWNRIEAGSDKIVYDFYRRYIGYNGLFYRDINGREWPVPTVTGETTTNYCTSDGANAVTTENGSQQMRYNNLYTLKSGSANVKTRLEALTQALNEFSSAVAAETDTFGAVDNKVAIVGFSSEGYKNTEILTGSDIGYRNNGSRFSEGSYYFPYKGQYYDNATNGSSGATNYTGPQYYNESGTGIVRINNTHYKNALISANNGTAGTVNPNLTKAIKSIGAYGGTQPADGFDMAANIIQQRATKQYTLRSGEHKGEPVNRNVIVIYFTDGRPGNNSEVDQYAEANLVVNKAKTVKEMGASVFSIGVFGESDANPLTYSEYDSYTSEDDGDAHLYLLDFVRRSDLVTSEKYGFMWGNTRYYHNYYYRYWISGRQTAYGDTPNDTIYDYMSVVSSNYPGASYFMDSNWNSSTESWKDMTARVRGTAPQSNNYYRMASNQDTLVAAFEAAVTMINTNTSEQETVTLDSTAILRDTVNTTALDVSGATYTARRVPIKYDNGNFTEDTSRTATVITGHENVPVPSNGQISVDGFNYKDDRTSATNPEGWKLVVTISGLVPKQMGTQVDSNVGNAGIYGPSTEKPAVSIASPKLITAGLAKTYVIDFNAPMTVAENTTKLGATAGTNGTFDFKQPTVTYKLKSDETMVGGANIALSGVDSAMVYGKPVNTNAEIAWNKIITVPASSVYFDDDLLNGTAIPVGDGSGYNAAFNNSANYTENADKNMEKGQYTFTFYGSGIDVYCTTDTTSKYIQGKIDEGEGQLFQTIKNRVDNAGNVRYNVPTLSFRDLGQGQHTLTLYVLSTSDYKIDGIRVYNPASEQVYTENNVTSEQYGYYKSLRDLLVNQSEQYIYSEGDEAKGVLFVDNADELGRTKQVKDDEGNVVVDPETNEPVEESAYGGTYNAYKTNSPKHEIYLSKNQGLIFSLEGVKNLAKTAKFMVGLSVAANGESATVGGIEGGTVASPVDMYYTLTPDVDEETGNTATFALMNNSTSDVVLSVTNLKIVGNNAPVSIKIQDNAMTLSVEDDLDTTDAAEPVTLNMVVNENTFRTAAKMLFGVTDEPETPDDPDPTTEPEVTPDPTPAPAETPAPEVTPEPTQAPSVHDIVKQIVSSFVSNLFRSISRLFGN